MNSENEHFSEGKKDGILASSLESQERSEILHITTKGKDGKVLRKKLAISLGLRNNTSASTSATSHSEGEDSQNVVEVFRKQVRKTVDSRSKNSQKPVQEELGHTSRDKSSLIIRKMVRKTTDIIDEVLEEDVDDFDDTDETETDFQGRSKDRRLATTGKTQTFEKIHDTSIDKQKTARKATEAANMNEYLNEENSEKQRKKARSKETRDYEKETFGSKMENKNGEHVGKNRKMFEIESLGLESENEKQGALSVTSTEAETFNSHIEANFGTTKSESEEIFSSYGEQLEEISDHQTSATESVKLLREKIRKNARARKMPKARVDRDEKEENRRGQEQITKTSRIKSDRELNETSSVFTDKNNDVPSNIPLPVAKSKVSDTQVRLGGQELYLDDKNADNDEDSINKRRSDLQKERFQKSKIPRRKSQNAKDEMVPRRVRFKSDEIREQGVGAGLQSVTSMQFTTEGESGMLSKSDKIEREKHSQQNSRQRMSQLVRKFSGTSKDSLILTAVTKQKHSLDTNMTTINNKSTHNLTTTSQQNTPSQGTTIITSIHKATNINHFDLDSFEAELAKLKESVFKTYEEFQDIWNLTVSVREELNELRDTYGSFC